MIQLALIDFTQSRDQSEKSRPLILSHKQGDTNITYRIKPSANAKLRRHLRHEVQLEDSVRKSLRKSPQMDDFIQPLHQERLGDRNKRG